MKFLQYINNGCKRYNFTYLRYLFVIYFNLMMILNVQGQQSLLKLDYGSEEIFPIKIDNYGFPNVKIIYGNEPIWIIWDTGDMIGLVMSKEIIKKNRLSVEDSIRLRDSEGNFVGYSYRYVADTVIIFDEVITNVSISSGEPNYNGLIGPQFVNLNRFTIDYQNRLIGISMNALPDNEIVKETIPMVRSDIFPRLIIIAGVVRDKRVLIELDTGKSRTVIDPELVEELNLGEGEYGVIIDNLQIGKNRFEINNGKLKSFKGISKSLSEPIRIGIGSDILEQFLFTVDYEQGIVVLGDVN